MLSLEAIDKAGICSNEEVVIQMDAIDYFADVNSILIRVVRSVAGIANIDGDRAFFGVIVRAEALAGDFISLTG
jgi:hypothetical protein